MSNFFVFLTLFMILIRKYILSLHESVCNRLNNSELKLQL